jgi:acetyl-CoA carboxylase biotin carboxyl carrier protein
MSRATIPLLAAAEADGGTVLRSPAVGLWSDRPEEGAELIPGSAAGTLTQLSRRLTLIVPEDVVGRAVFEARTPGTIAVEFGQPLFRVVPHAAGEARGKGGKKAAPRTAGGAIAIVAPTDGVFYRAPATGAAPYVAPGDRIRSGQAVGLIEVMKTFNPIAYGGAGLPEDVSVVEVLAADGQEVRAGQVLVLVQGS